MKSFFQKPEGFVTLTAVLLLGAVSLVIAVGLLLSGIDYSKTTFATQESSQAEGLANSCVEEGLANLWGNAGYVGTGSLSLGASGSCDYAVATGFPVDATSLVLLLGMDEAPGATTFNDATTNSNDGVCAGAQCPTAGIAAKFSTNGLNFDGADDFVTISHDATINLSSAGTYTAWVKPTLTNNEVVWDKSQIGNSNYCMVSNNHNGVSNGLHCVVGSTTYSSFQGVIVPSQWNHIGFTWQGGAFAMYANGRFVQGGVLTSTVASNSQPLTLGKNAIIGTDFYSGSLDGVGIWNVALNSNEMRDLYEFGPLKVTGSVVRGSATVGTTTKAAEALVISPLPSIDKAAQHIIIY